MNAKRITRLGGMFAIAVTVATAGCGQYVRDSRSPIRVVITHMLAIRGARTPQPPQETLVSDVITNVGAPPVATVFNDMGQVAMIGVLRDQGIPGNVAEPSLLNQVTINRYRIVYRRTDGRNVQGVDVPFAFDSAVTFIVPNEGTVTAAFELVRHSAKEEPPLRALAFNGLIINTIAEVTFFGRDLAGNEVAATGNIAVNFGDFGDPQ